LTKEEFDRARLQRQDQIRRDKVRLSSPSTRLVGVEIFANSNFKTGASWHSQVKMAESLGINVKSVKRALPQLITAGYIRVKKVWKNNIYEIVLQETSGDKLSPDEAGSGDKIDGLRGQKQPGSGDKIAPLTLKVNSEENSKYISTADLDLEFEKWFAAYPRRAGKSEACKEYHRIIQEKLATTEQLMFGAEAYAAERSGQDHTFTKKPVKWLSAEGWLDEPAAPLETGGYASRLARRYGRSGHDAVINAAARKVNEIYQRGAPVSQGGSILASIDRELAIIERQEEAQRVPPPAPRIAARPPPPKAPPRPDAKRGQYEIEIRAALGSDVFDELPEPVIAGLCARWAFGKVPAAELDALRLQHVQARATGPPAAAPTRVVHRRV
jgi:hypothetical protein